MTRAESIAILKDLHAQATYYARDTDSHIGSPLMNLPFDTGANSFAAMAAQMNFTDGSGFRVADGTLSWKTWAGQLEALVGGMLQWRSEKGWPPKLAGADDPLGQWWADVAAKQLSTLSVGEFISDVTEPARQAASAAAGVLEYGAPLVVAVVIILVLIIVVKVT